VNADGFDYLQTHVPNNVNTGRTWNSTQYIYIYILRTDLAIRLHGV